MRILTLLSRSLILLAVFACHSFADNYPSKPIKIVVPFTAGSSSDISTRKIAALVAERLDQPLIVENRPGAAGSIGTAMVAKAAADGYSLTFTNYTTLCVNPHAYTNVGYDALRDFAPIIIAYRGQGILVVPATSALRSVADLVRTAKAQPGKLSFASGGVGSAQHLMTERLKQVAGIDLLHVPYKSEAQFHPELIAGQLSVAFSFPAATLPHIRAGKLRALAVSSAKRLSALPDVPTLAEAGIAGYDERIWAGFAAPAGTPVGRLRKLHAAFQAALRSLEFGRYLDTIGYELVAGTQEEAAALIKADHERYAGVVKALGLRVE